MAGRFGRRVRWGRVGRSAGHLLQAWRAHWLIAGLTVGIISATRARSLFDRFSTVAVLIGLSMPVFVIGELPILVVFLPLNEHGFHWIQTGHRGPSQGLGAWFGHMILPWITLAAVQAAVYSRLSRGQLLDTLGEDYIRTARAQGPVRAAGDLQAGVRRGGRWRQPGGLPLRPERQRQDHHGDGRDRAAHRL